MNTLQINNDQATMTTTNNENKNPTSITTNNPYKIKKPINRNELLNTQFITAATLLQQELQMNEGNNQQERPSIITPHSTRFTTNHDTDTNIHNNNNNTNTNHNNNNIFTFNLQLSSPSPYEEEHIPYVLQTDPQLLAQEFLQETNTDTETTETTETTNNTNPIVNTNNNNDNDSDNDITQTQTTGENHTLPFKHIQQHITQLQLLQNPKPTGILQNRNTLTRDTTNVSENINTNTNEKQTSSKNNNIDLEPKYEPIRNVIASQFIVFKDFIIELADTAIMTSNKIADKQNATNRLNEHEGEASFIPRSVRINLSLTMSEDL